MIGIDRAKGPHAFTMPAEVTQEEGDTDQGIPAVMQVWQDDPAVSLTADDGLLVIAVPDRESWDAEHYGSDWAAYDVPRHFSHFRCSDIHRLVTAHGFEPLAVRPMWLDAPYIALLSERYRGHGPVMALLRGVLFGTWSNLVSAVSDRPTSSSLYLFRKAAV